MIRRIAFGVAISLFVAHHHLQAQDLTPKSSASNSEIKHDSTAAHLLGTWDGTIVTDHTAESPLRIVMSHSPGPTIAVQMNVNGQIVSGGPSSNIRLDGNTLSWTQNLMDEDCKASGTFSEGAFKGEFSCPHGTGSFIVKKN
ncbi:MAG: hypothetical protein ABJC26_10020 [Gemmatimonadaceae bacterium]